jgi:hypothetical protein
MDYHRNQQNLNGDKGNVANQVDKDMVGVMEDRIVDKIKDRRQKNKQ